MRTTKRKSKTRGGTFAQGSRKRFNISPSMIHTMREIHRAHPAKFTADCFDGRSINALFARNLISIDSRNRVKLTNFGHTMRYAGIHLKRYFEEK